jgi:hypothetical protein
MRIKTAIASTNSAPMNYEDACTQEESFNPGFVCFNDIENEGC